MGLMDSSRRKMLNAQKEEEIEESKEASEMKETENFEEKLEERIIENRVEKPLKNQEPEMTKYTVEIPAGCKLDQIHALKDFLASQAPGVIGIYILLSGKEIDTKFSIGSIEELKSWEEKSL